MSDVATWLRKSASALDLHADRKMAAAEAKLWLANIRLKRVLDRVAK